MTISIDKLKSTIEKKGYKWYLDRPNIIGIRSTLDVPDSFNDFLCVVSQSPEMPKGLDIKSQQSWLNKNGFVGLNGKPLVEDGKSGKNTNFAISELEKVSGKDSLKIYPITTNPGVYWLNNPMSKMGSAILKPGQWEDCWSIGFHQGKSDHRALVQIGKVTVYRDNNRDNNYQLLENNTQTGLFGINIHGSSKSGKSHKIGKWSAGCQVFSTWTHKEEFIDICEKSKTLTKNKFTYTLLDEVDLV